MEHPGKRKTAQVGPPSDSLTLARLAGFQPKRFCPPDDA